MIDTTLEQQLHDELAHLSPDKQRQVLDYARSLVQGRPVGVPGNVLVQIKSLIPPDDLKLMVQAIEEEFGYVDSVV